MELLGDVGHVESCFGPFEGEVSIHARMVCIKRTIGSEIILDAPDGTLGDEAQVKAHFGPFVDSVNLHSR
jgi:hypothetical protein